MESIQNTSVVPTQKKPQQIVALAWQGIILPDVLYSLPFFKECLGISHSTIQEARLNGLATYEVHGRGYVLGTHWIEYVLKHPFIPGKRSPKKSEKEEYL